MFKQFDNIVICALKAVRAAVTAAVNPSRSALVAGLSSMTVQVTKRTGETCSDTN
ncbi:hypothetical protein A2U01_0089120 [Trifolium medium]|uniref:Uncharacterized protein n=1 Tax=Trifolium medium TaxID=97028 RepID=A0A392U334_9FABA|nr:hypothetical protein [Trifolium medium]